METFLYLLALSLSCFGAGFYFGFRTISSEAFVESLKTLNNDQLKKIAAVALSIITTRAHR